MEAAEADDETPRRFALLGLVLFLLAGCGTIRAWMPFSGKEATTKRPAPSVVRTTGTLLLAGGGRTPGAIVAEAAKLAAANARVLVIPLASAARDPGKASLEMWLRAGFAQGEILDAESPERAAAQIEAAGFLWMTGGEATRLVGRLLDANLADAVRRRYEAGALVGGNAAGAAALAELLVAGGDEDEIVQGRVQTVGGLGLWPGVIADPDFVAKKRFNRLAAAVLDHPRLVGVGIDDATGVVVSGTTLRVVGDGSVVVLDARRAKVNASRAGEASSATGVEMQVLAAGMTFDLAR